MSSNNCFKMEETDTKFKDRNGTGTGRNSKLAKASARLVTIEPILFLAMCYFGNTSWNSQYLQRRIATEKYNFTLPNTSNASCVTNTSDPDYITEQNIQSDVAQWTLYLGICNSLPGMVATITIGALSDVYGRKIALFSPILGCTLQLVVNILVITCHLPIGVLLLGSLILGFSGGYPLLLASCMSYIADITRENKRTFRVAIIDITILAAMGSSELGMGYLIDASGFLAPAILLLGLEILCLLYIIIPKVLLETIDRDPDASVANQIATTWKSVQMLFQENTNRRRWRLLLLGTCSFIVQLVMTSYMSLIVVYALGEPFCWTSIQLGFFLSGTLLIHATVCAIAAKVLTKFISDTWILHICLASLIAWMLFVGLADTTAMLFVSSCVGCLGSLAPPVVRSIISKSVESHEIGVMFSFLSAAVSASEFVGPMILTSIYSATVLFNPPLVFYVATGISVIPVILTCIYQLLSRHPYRQFEDDDDDDSIIDNEEINSVNTSKHYDNHVGLANESDA